MQVIRKILGTLIPACPVPTQPAFRAVQHDFGLVQQEVCPFGHRFQAFREDLEFCRAVYTAPTELHNTLHFTQHACADQYCVYTDIQFSAGRGISIVTTAGALHSSALVQRSKGHDQNEVVVKTAVDAFETREILGKGIGLVARRPLRRGELIVSESPSLIVHLETQDHISKERKLEIQRAAVETLPPATKAQILELMGNDEEDAIEARLQVNSFALTLNKTVDHHGLFTQSSRFNHACRPNCFYRFDPQTLTQSIYTIRDIDVGEELTISYFNPAVTSEERQRAVEPWGFNCSCTACTLPPEAREASDATIRLIHQYTKELRDWSDQSRGTPGMAESLIELYRKEGLFCSIADGYRLAAYAYNAVREKNNALIVAHKAIGYGLQTWKDTETKRMDVLRLMQEPESHWTWNQRSRV